MHTRTARARIRGFFVVAVFAAAPFRLAADTVISHEPPGCLAAERFPRIEACIRSSGETARVRVFFSKHDDPHWYYVELAPAGQCFVGALPRPKKDAGRIRYYIEATGRSFGTSRTPEYAPAVVAGPGECGMEGGVAAAATTTSVLVGAPAGAPAVPTGFGAAGLTSIGAATAGGLGTAAIVGGGALAVGAATAAVVVVGGRDQGAEGPYVVEGIVYDLDNANPGLISPTNSGPPVQGARVSTSLDGRTATTDARGFFSLVTETPKSKSECPSQPRGERGGLVYTVTIAKAGCTTVSETRQWGCQRAGGIPPSTWNMPCP